MTNGYEITVINPKYDEGTEILECTGTTKKSLGRSVSFNIREGEKDKSGSWVGCPSRINLIVVGDDVDAAKKGPKLELNPDNIASSSATGTKVTMLQVAADGEPISLRHFAYLLVAKSHPGSPFPIADEIWVSDDPFGDSDELRRAEKKCKDQAQRLGSGS